MAAHYILLRHQEGADWDYCLIKHLGQRATVEITPPPPTATSATAPGAWHEDTFVGGPSWAEFQKTMDFAGSGNSVYIVSVHRQAPGHRVQLQELLSRPDPDIEGGWQCRAAASRGRRVDVPDHHPIQLVAGLRRRSDERGRWTGLARDTAAFGVS